MSSRSREKVANVFRKIFKGSSTAAKMEAGEGKDKKVNKNGNSPSESPLKRFKRADNKVSPAPPPAAATSDNGSGNNNNNNASSNNSKKPQAQTMPLPPPVQTLSKVPCNHDNTIRSRRLMKEYCDMRKMQSNKNSIFTVELVNDNIYEWYVRLHTLDPDSLLAKDMKELKIPHITLNLRFPEKFPFHPPFMRVVSPIVEKGYVMEGGAICMELLTPHGWASAYTVEAVIMQFAASVVKGQGRISRRHKASREFTLRAAEESFRSIVKTHEKYGWVTPALSDG